MSEFFAAFVGALIALIGTYFLNKKDTVRSARYLAIRIVCIFDKYLEDCVRVVNDPGFLYDELTPNGYLAPRECAPGAPIFPSDIDWKSIDHNLMYEILSFPSDVEAADRVIELTWYEVALPPDYAEGFEERAFHYAQFGLRAYALAKKLRKKYHIPVKEYGEWNPIFELEKELQKIKDARSYREKRHAEFIASIEPKGAVV